MATTTGDNTTYPSAKAHFSDGTIDFDDNAFGIILLKSAYDPGTTAATDEFVSDIVAHEVDTGGYSRQALAAVVWELASGGSGQMRLSATNPVWTATGSDMTSHYWVLYHATPGSDATRHILCYGLLDITAGGTDVVTTNGNTLTLNLPTDGFFTLG